MAHHAYFYAGDREAGIEAARAYARAQLSLEGDNSPDLIVLTHGLFSVDDARRVIRLADQAAVGAEKIIIIVCERIFHEAQNALLKLFEEPPPGTTLVLILPTEGVLIPTLRSRMLPLPGTQLHVEKNELLDAFLAAKAPEREKIITKLIDRTKSDREEEKQAARGDALRLVEGLQKAVHKAWRASSSDDLEQFMRDLDRFIPIMSDRSAPLKLIFEHILLVLPEELTI